MTVESNRMLGLIGASLTVLGSVGSLLSFMQYFIAESYIASLIASLFGGLLGFLGFVGFILFLVAMYDFSRDYGERGIFWNIIYGLIAAVVAVGAIVGLFLIIIFLNLGNIISDYTTTSNLIGSLISFLPFASITAVLVAWFYLRAFNLLANKTQVPLFKTGGIALLAVSCLGLGVSVIFAGFGYVSAISLTDLSHLSSLVSVFQGVAWALLAMAFFRIPAPAPAPFVTPPVMQVKYCPHCGTQNQTDAQYCIRCGQKFQA